MQSIAQHPAVPIGTLAREASTADQLVGLWLHGRSEHIQRAYAADAERFRAYVGPLTTATLGHIQTFADSLDGAPASRARTLAAAKSLLSFGQRVVTYR